MGARDHYFRTLERMTGSLSGISDPVVGDAFARLKNLFHLMDLRTMAGDEPTIDFSMSGLPILREVISVANDLQDGEPSVLAPPRPRPRITDDMLDDMLTRRRLPSERLVREMARNVYWEEIASIRATDSEALAVFQPHASRSYAFRKLESGGGTASWDFWDGTKSRAVRMSAKFEAFGEIPNAEIDAVKTAAVRFSSTGFSPLSLATEIDDVTRVLRLTELTKIIIGPFISEIFSKVDDPVMEALKASVNLDDAWAIRWAVERIKAGETTWIRKGFFRRSTPRQNFVVDLQNPECAMRSVTSVDFHAAMPHTIFQRLAEKRHECASLKNSSIHVLSGSNLIENS